MAARFNGKPKWNLDSIGLKQMKQSDLQKYSRGDQWESSEEKNELTSILVRGCK